MSILRRWRRGTMGMIGADLENLTNEAALVTLRKNKEKTEMHDFEEAEYPSSSTGYGDNDRVAI